MWNKLGHLSEEYVSYLNEYYDNNQSKLEVIDWWNVMGVKLLKLNTLDDPTFLELEMEMYQLVDNKNLLPDAQYMLEYQERSFTIFHTDSVSGKGDNSLTTVTLINQSEDLVGGKALFKEDNEAITVLDQDVGEVLSYGHNVEHGVSKVLKGTRRVYINWYKSRMDN